MNIRVLIALTIVVSTAAGAQTEPALTLQTAIRRALETHPDVGSAAERVRAASGARLTARSWTNPTLNYEIEDEPVSGAQGQPLMVRRASAFAVIPLEPIYQLRSRSSRASAELRRSEAELRDAQRATALAAAEAFHRTANANVGVETSREVLAWLDSLVDYTRKRAEEGVTAEADLVRLQVERGRVETDLTMADVELARARAELGRLTGLATVPLVEVTVDSVALGSPLPALDRLLSLAQRNRPDVRAAEAGVDAAGAGVAMERGAIVREIAAMAGVMTMEGQRSLMAGISLPFPLFDQNRGEIQRASAERRMAELQRTLVERGVVADVTSEYFAVRALGDQLKRLNATFLGRAEEGRRIADAAYREGAVPLVQVLDAARAHAEARMVYYRALFAWQQSIVALNAAIGSAELTTMPNAEVR